MALPPPRLPLSEVLPPLILGTATFNHQYHPDPTHMPYVDIVRRALAHRVNAFDTSPYYGPSETLLGQALSRLAPPPPRDTYFLITKAGRIGPDEFDYSPAWVRYSVCRSLDRLRTNYLDLVYMHDVEFVSPAEVLAAVIELRSLRDRGLIRYVGISGYPVAVLASLAEMVLSETGEPLDAVMSYSHFCIQNDTLGNEAFVSRFRAAGVACLPNASMLSMGLITTKGADNTQVASWHPAPPALRKACHGLARIAERHGERLEKLAIRWSLQNWARRGAELGTAAAANEEGAQAKIGVSVMGVAAVEELEETMRVWKEVTRTDDPVSQQRRERIDQIVSGKMWPSLGRWKNYSWESGGPGFVNRRTVLGAIPKDAVAERWGLTSEVATLAKF